MKNKDIIRFIEARVEEHQKNLASYEKIKRFTLLPEPFMMGCELTDTLKLRRPVVLQKYATEIEAMYEESRVCRLSTISYLRGKFKKEKNI